MTDVFISYSRTDRDLVAKLARDLKARGISVFFDQLITPGDSWADSLSQAIERARYLLVVMSPEYFSSLWTQEELKIGLLREAEGKARVIPLMAHRVELPELLAAKTYADFTGSYEEGLQSLVPVLARNAQKQEPDAPGSLRADASGVEIARLRDELRNAVAVFKSGTAHSDAPPVNHSSDGSRHCFIVMPFGDSALEVVFEDFVRPVIEEQSA